MAADASNNHDDKAAAADTAASGEADRRAGARPRPSLTIDLTARDVPPARSAAQGEAPEPERMGEFTASGAGSQGGANMGDADISGAQIGGAESASRPESAARFPGGAPRAFAQADALPRNLLIGAAGGLIALVAVLVLQSAGVLPSPGRSAARQASEQASKVAETVAALDRRVTAIETATQPVAEMRQDLKALSDKVAGLDAIRPAIASRGDLDALAATVTALGKRLDSAPPAVTRDELSALADRLGRLEATAAAGGDGQAAGSAAVASLTAQFNQAETDVRKLSDRLTAAEARAAEPGNPDAVRAVAVAGLRRASSDGKPFAAEVDTVANLGVGGGDIAVIRPLAAKGVASVADLQADFPDTANAILTATTSAQPDANFLQRALAGLGSIVQIRPVGPVAGKDPPAIVSRMSDEVTKGDLAAALAERDGLAQAGKDASAAWAAKAADRAALDQAVERIAATAAGKTG